MFISHSSKDVSLVEELIEILEVIGVSDEDIFCTSVEGYGISLGENFLETIKNKLSPHTLVLFLISENFYESPVSLCEMGATWIQSNSHIPILIPPMTFEKVKGVIPLTQGVYINNKDKINSLKLSIENYFGIENNDSIKWEKRRDKILKRIKEIIENNNISNSETREIDVSDEIKNKKLKENINYNNGKNKNHNISESLFLKNPDPTVSLRKKLGRNIYAKYDIHSHENERFEENIGSNEFIERIINSRLELLDYLMKLREKTDYADIPHELRKNINEYVIYCVDKIKNGGKPEKIHHNSRSDLTFKYVKKIFDLVEKYTDSEIRKNEGIKLLDI